MTAEQTKKSIRFFNDREIPEWLNYGNNSLDRKSHIKAMAYTRADC